MNFSFLMNGAGQIKKDVDSFKACVAMLATDASICANVKEQLLAASVAIAGKANTGLSEKGWRPLAEVIGMVSPRSDKLIIPRGYTPVEWKTEVMATFLKTGYYPSSRTDGAGGSAAIKDVEQLHTMGLTAKKDPLKGELAKLREVPDISQDLQEVGFE